MIVSSPAAELFRSAEAQLARGDFAEALRLAKEAIQLDPRNPEGYLLMSRALFRMERFEESMRAARRAVVLNPNDPRSHLALARALLHLGRFREALASVSRAIRLDPRNAAAYALRAIVYEQLGQRDKMLADLETAARLAPSRYGEMLRMAKAGKRLFDPKDKSTWSVLDGKLPPQPGISWTTPSASCRRSDEFHTIVVPPGRARRRRSKKFVKDVSSRPVDLPPG